MDKEAPKKYWISASEKDWEVAEHLFASKDYVHSLYLMHLSLEKILKALVVDRTGKQPPYTHNLLHLAKKTELEISEEQKQFLTDMNKFQLEARYPDEKFSIYKQCNLAFTKKYLKKSREMRSWSFKMLT